ncbi:ComF family protein [Cerasicoccus fimbriatus]|uniref:ComF family protein n=1 Tax=Cerasicoccus fimbriatus TaxID=3014554 RepID=UPI0022B3D642|nr:ComF family protein [Cerasicoccus sp. TK19100]
MPPFSRQLQNWSNGILDLLYPRECLITGDPVESNSPCRFLSSSALEMIWFIDEPHCHTCGAPFFGDLLALRECPHCRELNPAFERGRSLFLLRDAGREIVHEIKYRKGRHLLPDLQPILKRRAKFRSFLCDAVLIPIPLHPTRQRERGYNQSELIARELSAASGSPMADILRRTKFTETQTRLDRAARQANLRGAFELAKGAQLAPDQRYILVDDVFTTGATLNSAAKTLLQCGAEQIDVVTLGHG